MKGEICVSSFYCAIFALITSADLPVLRMVSHLQSAEDSASGNQGGLAVLGNWDDLVATDC